MEPQVNGSPSKEIHEKLITFLKQAKIEYELLSHPPTPTSQEAAKVRGTSLTQGAKALLLKVDGKFSLFVMQAHLKLSSKAVKKYFKAKKVRFATSDELFELTSLVPGSVPPFGKPLFDYDLYVDEGLLFEPVIAFNAASLTDSIIMKTSYYKAVAEPKVFAFASS